MQTLQQELKEPRRVTNLVAELVQDWRSRLVCDCPELNAIARESIILWLLGKDLERFERLNSFELALAQQAMAYRWRILQQRYLGVSPNLAYHRLTTRLGSLVIVRNKIRALVNLSQDRASALADVLQELIQELLQRDRYIQQQLAWITECTKDAKLRTSLLLATTEEYCLRPIRNQPLIVYRFVNHLRRTQQGGVTQVPSNNLIRLFSDEILTIESDSPFTFSDTLALSAYQDTQEREEQQAMRQVVKQEFAIYLEAQLGSTAVQWLQMYLQGKSQEAIATALNLSVKEVYRLRERVSYHAVRVFGLKNHPELVSNWLETSLEENNFGLTPQQWQQFCERLPSSQRQVLELKKAGKNLDQIATALNRKITRVTSEWNHLCLAAKAIRSEG